MQFEGYEVNLAETPRGFCLYCCELAEQIGVPCETIHKIIRQLKKELPPKVFHIAYMDAVVSYQTKQDCCKENTFIVHACGVKEILKRLPKKEKKSLPEKALISEGHLPDGYEYALQNGNQNYAIVLKQGRPTVSSLDIAKAFGKQHFHVLRDIELIINDLPQELRESNFGLSKYESKSGKNTVKDLPMYNLSRDGFMLLIMRFTGKAAMQIKVDFLRAFHEMERLLKEYQEKHSLRLPERVEWHIENKSILYINTIPVLPESMLPNLLEMSEYAWAYCKQEAENYLFGGIDYYRFSGEEANAIKNGLSVCPFLCLAKSDVQMRLWSFGGIRKVYENHKLYSQNILDRLNNMYFGVALQ